MARVYGCVLAVYTAVYMVRTRPCNGGVHVCVCTRLCTRLWTGRVHGSYAVCYCDFLCKRHLLCRNVQLQIHYIQKEL